ncbi:MAG TPA: FAD-binding oxidoreductase [Candidatus Limnocylindrales bacterium]|nr:FAD-binding oxidoreductase [Candidatus Limnocylindrales bacterium]
MSVARTEAARPNVRMDTGAFAALGPGQLRPGRSTDALDGLVPQAVVTARDPDQVRNAVEEARAKRLGIVVSGGGTRLHVGNVPRSFDIKLSTTAIGRIVEQNPEDMTVTCEAGVSLLRLQRNLAKTGQRLCVDVAVDERSTLGGIVASNAAGGLRYGFGTPRDLVLGMTVIDGAGRTVHAGGRVVKNVAGYDLVRLFTGSLGSLGIVMEMTLRTHPQPDAAATLVFDYAAASELDAARARLVASPLPLAALDFAVDAGADTAVWSLVVRIEGTEAEVAYQGDRVCELARRDPAQALEEWLSPAHVDGGDGVTIRVGTAPAELLMLVQDAVAAARGHAVFAGGHLGDGIARIHVPAGGEAALSALMSATAGAGTRVIERAPTAARRGMDVWSPVPASLDLMRELKRRFDPDGVLAPGRLVGGL